MGPNQISTVVGPIRVDTPTAAHASGGDVTATVANLGQAVITEAQASLAGRQVWEDVEHWLNDEIADGLASSSVHRHYRTLRRVLQTAVEKDRLIANPCDRVRPPKVTTREMTVLDWRQSRPARGCTRRAATGR